MDDRLQCIAQRLVVTHAVGGAADGVELQCPAAQTKFVEESGQHLEHFGVARRRLAACAGRADDLGVDLIELAVTSLLRTLAAEHRAETVELLQSTAFVESVLNVGAHDACSGFGAKGHRLRLFAGGAALVFPGEHFFGDDVGLFADTAREQLGVFENRGANLVEVVTREDGAHLVLHTVPEVGVGWKQVTSSADGTNHNG